MPPDVGLGTQEQMEPGRAPLQGEGAPLKPSLQAVSEKVPYPRINTVLVEDPPQMAEYRDAPLLSDRVATAENMNEVFIGEPALSADRTVPLATSG